MISLKNFFIHPNIGVNKVWINSRKVAYISGMYYQFNKMSLYYDGPDTDSTE